MKHVVETYEDIFLLQKMTKTWIRGYFDRCDVERSLYNF